MAQSKSLSKVFSYDSLVHAIAGSTGSMIAMTTFYPLDTVRSRLQLEDPKKRQALSTIDVLKQLIKDEGFFTLYRGLVPVIESLCISNFVYFYTFHGLKALKGKGSGQSAVRDLLLGSVAGIINVLSTTPFWVVNTRLKMKGIQGHDSDVCKHYNNLAEGLIFVAKTEGIKGLWAGAIPSLMLVINPALQFMMYELVKRNMTKYYGELPTISYFVIGAMAKAFATVLTYPLQLVQTKLRHGNTDKNMNLPPNTGALELLLHIFKLQGIKGIYRGLEAKLLQTVLTAALMFAAYEKIAKYVITLLSANGKKSR